MRFNDLGSKLGEQVKYVVRARRKSGRCNRKSNKGVSGVERLKLVSHHRQPCNVSLGGICCLITTRHGASVLQAMYQPLVVELASLSASGLCGASTASMQQLNHLSPNKHVPICDVGLLTSISNQPCRPACGLIAPAAYRKWLRSFKFDVPCPIYRKQRHPVSSTQGLASRQPGDD
jgi:hypothetical protein